MNRIFSFIKAVNSFFYTYCSVIPLIFAVMLFFHPISIYIPELNLDLIEPFSPFVFILICLIWRYCTPYHKCFKTGSVLSLMFYLVPEEILCFLVFAEHSFVFSVVLLIAVILIPVSFRLWIRYDEVKTGADEKDKKENIMICRRFFLIVFPVIMLIPAFAVVLGLGFVPPEFSSSYYDEGHTIYDGLDELPDRTRPSLGDELTAFIGSSGDEYTAEQKLDLLQKLADYETFCLGSARVQVVSKRLEENVYGSYSPGNTYLTVDYKHLNTSPTSAIIRTLLHEVYHSYQFYIIIKTDWKSDLAKTGYFDKALDWAKNLLSYKDGYNDYDAYSEQPLEADAADFAKTEWIILRNEAGLSA